MKPVTAKLNDTSDVRIDTMPFGGFKRSGGFGRERIASAIEAMTEPKNVIVRTLSGRS